MTPETLTLTAFGPFADAQTVDFRALGPSPLFLINGPTGSGKSALLDGICFALYGETTGDEREGEQMRSHHAAPDLETEVVFQFRLHDQRYRVRRRPKQSLPKKRGEGFRDVPPEAYLSRLNEDGSEESIASRKVKEVTDAIVRLTGLEAKQFRQVMVLPQGRFRELLLAPSKDREQIFSQLFQTDIYKQIQDRLLERANEISRTVREKQAELKTLLEHESLEGPEALDEAVQSLQSQLAALEPKLVEHRQNLKLAEARCTEAKALADIFAQHDRAQKTLTELSQQSAVQQANLARVQRAQQAERLTPVWQADQTQQTRVTHLQQALATQHGALVEAQRVFQQAQRDAEQVPELTQKRDSAREEQRDLEQLRPKWVEQQALTKQRNKLTAELTQLAQALERLVNRQQALQAEQNKDDQQRQVLEQQLTGHAELAARLEQLTQLLPRRRSLEQQRIRYRAVQADLGKHEADLTLAEADCQRATEQADRLELRWHQGQAALLARKLEAGQACPVCGSCDHPQPAQGDGTLVERADVEAARQTQQSAQRRVNEEQLQLGRLKEQLSEMKNQGCDLKAQLGEWADRSVDEISQERDQCLAALQRLDGCRKQVEQLNQQRQQQETELTQLKQQIDQHQADQTQLRAKEAELKGQWQSVQQALQARVDDPAKIEPRLTELHTRIATLGEQVATLEQAKADQSVKLAESQARLESVQQQVEAALQEAEQHQQQWQQALSASGFEDDQQWQAARLSESESQQLQADYDRHQQQLATTQGSVDSLAQQLSGKTVPDLPRLTQQRDIEAQALNALEQQQQQRCAAQLRSLEKVQRAIVKIRQQCQQLEQAYAVCGTLSEVANGKTGSRVSLQRFVLGVLLDEVLEQATERLLRMSKGRYRLLRSDASKGNSATGLDLKVEDGYTGTDREVATLSGGESFLAALSLALGLSDVVQSWAGGIRLDTLFIDEGFGSLDPESLELAVHTLIELQASGRTIGLISHVTELKEQLALQVSVTPSTSGSRVTLKGVPPA